MLARSYCNGHYKRWSKYGDPLGRASRHECAHEGCPELLVRATFCKRHALKAWKREHSDRVNAHNRRYNASKPDVMKAARARWEAKNPHSRAEMRMTRRTRKAGQFVEKVYKSKLLRLHSGLCGICGEPVDPAHFDVDHVYPLCLGGEHSYANTQPAHPLCNQRKGAAEYVTATVIECIERVAA